MGKEDTHKVVPIKKGIEELEELADESLDVVPVVQANSLSDEGLRLRAKRGYVFLNRTLTDIAEEFSVSITTVRYWRDKEGWDKLKQDADGLREDFQNALVLTKDPNVTMEDLKENAIRKVMNVVLLSSTKLEHLLSQNSDDMSKIPLAGEVQKLTAALEKLISAEGKNKNGGAEPGRKDTVTHIHLDVNEAMRLVQEARKKGTKITVEEAMNILKATQDSKK